MQNANRPFSSIQVTLEDTMICGALQTLNEEAYEDVYSERPSPSPTGQPGEMNALLQQQLAPIRESAECSSLLDDHAISFGSQNGLVLQDHHATALMHGQSHSHTTAPPPPPPQHKISNTVGHGYSHQQPQQQQQQAYNSYAHNVAFASDPNIDPLPTVIIIPSNTVDDTPL